MDKSKEDIKLDKIGKLLELGGTMLANHCECGAPLFRYHGNVICPICDSNSKGAIESQGKIEKTSKKPEEKPPITSDQVEQKVKKVHISEKNSSLTGNQHFTEIPQSFVESSQSFTQSPQTLTDAQQLSAQPTGIPSNISKETYEFISNTIVNKVVQICLDLQRETDQGKIKQQIEAIESGTRALKNLR